MLPSKSSTDGSSARGAVFGATVPAFGALTKFEGKVVSSTVGADTGKFGIAFCANGSSVPGKSTGCCTGAGAGGAGV